MEPFRDHAPHSPTRRLRRNVAVETDKRGLVASTSEIILETEDLTKEFAGFVAVNGVSLRVARGSIGPRLHAEGSNL